MKYILIFFLLCSQICFGQSYPEFKPGRYEKGDTVKMTSKGSLFVAIRTFNASAIPSDNAYWDYAGPIVAAPDIEQRLKAVESDVQRLKEANLLLSESIAKIEDRLDNLPDTIKPQPEPEPEPDPEPDPQPDPGTTISFAIPILPASEYLPRPGAGIEQWHNGSDARAGLPQPLDVYHRFVWTRLEGATLGSYNWTYFDNLVNQAIAKKQKMSFGIMTEYSDGDGGVGLANYDGAYSSYPKYVHEQMQKESVKDWISSKSGTWVPNYNSQFYLDRLLALHKALNQHIADKGWQKVIQFIDVRGFGSWGEWNSSGIVDNVNQYPAGTFPTVATFKKIIDAHTQGFPDFPLVAMIAAFDAGWLNNTMIPVEVSYYVLTARNNWGPLGWRRDQWGATDQYLKDYLENNNRSFGNSGPFKNLIMERWKTAPITGEPMPLQSGNTFSDLVRQITLYHATLFGEGNYGSASGSALALNIREAARLAGYRYQIKSGTVTTKAKTVTVSVLWENVGIGPTYGNWKVLYELVDASGKTAFTHTARLNPKLFLPGQKSETDSFNAAVASGTYKLNVSVVDPNGYRDPMPLFNTGRESNGSYTLTTIKL